MVEIVASKKHFVSNVLCRLIHSLIRCYQWFIAPVLPKTCRFYPSCSEYGLEVVEQYGAIYGLWKLMGRLLRCHPWSVGGYDPVLPTGHTKNYEAKAK